MTLAAGSKFKVTAGSTGLGIPKGSGGIVRAVEVGPAGSVKVVLWLARTGKERVLWARHVNRLADPEVKLTNGDPYKAIRIAALPAGAAVPGTVRLS